MDPTDPTWFTSYVERSRQRRSLPSVQEWVSAHLQLPPPAVLSHKSAVTPQAQQYSARNDVRTAAGASGSGVDISFPPGSSSVNDYNIFANIALHDQAAATIVSASQRKSGFNSTMAAQEGVALNNFQLYLLDFIALHWTTAYSKLQTLTHQGSNHSKFVDDLLDVVEEGLRTVGAGNEDVRKARETVRALSQRLASNNSREEKLTLFSNFWMQRPNATDPVVYGIFYMKLKAGYVKSGKTEVLSITSDTFTVMYRLNSAVLIANEKTYNAMYKTSVDDWLAGHTI